MLLSAMKWTRVAAALGIVSLTGCMVGPKYRPPVAQVPTQFKEGGSPQTGTPDIVLVTVGVTKDGTLFVLVASAAWMQELQLMTPTVLARLGERSKAIKRIIWRADG